MNATDRKFDELMRELESSDAEELYNRMRKAFSALPREIRASLSRFFNAYGYWGRLDEDAGVFEEIAQKAAALSAHCADYRALYDRLADQRSKFTLYAVLSNRSRYDFESLARARENLFDEYFDLDLLRCTPEEVFVDLGAYVGDSVVSYLLNYGAECYKRIYCYEITPEVFAALERTLRDIPRVSLRQKGVSDRPGVMRLNVCKTSSSANTLGSEGVCDVEVTTLDADIPEPVTLIKADIEGSERQALKGAENHIKNERPKLLISVYHGNEDLTAIPHLIDSIRSDYAFYLRSKGTPLHPTELTLFAL